MRFQLAIFLQLIFAQFLQKMARKIYYSTAKTLLLTLTKNLRSHTLQLTHPDMPELHYLFVGSRACAANHYVIAEKCSMSSSSEFTILVKS